MSGCRQRWHCLKYTGFPRNWTDLSRWDMGNAWPWLIDSNNHRAPERTLPVLIEQGLQQLNLKLCSTFVACCACARLCVYICVCAVLLVVSGSSQYCGLLACCASVISLIKDNKRGTGRAASSYQPACLWWLWTWCTDLLCSLVLCCEERPL